MGGVSQFNILNCKYASLSYVVNAILHIKHSADTLYSLKSKKEIAGIYRLACCHKVHKVHECAVAATFKFEG